MCGIVGLFLKDPALESELGSMLADMLEELGDRGPDSTGVAVYGRETPGRWKLTVRLPADLTGPDLAAALGEALDVDVAMEARGVHALFSIPAEIAGKAVHWLRRERPDVVVVGEGRRMELYKDVGRPEAVTARIGLRQAAGTHGVGHTRMATEIGRHYRRRASVLDRRRINAWSTMARCPITMHLRRRLQPEGFSFRTENDTEVAAAYLDRR